MNDWISWLVAAGIVVTLEVFTGTFYLLMIAIGLAAGGVAALLGGGTSFQFIVAAVVGASATYALRRSKLGRTQKQDAARDPNVNLDIGQSIYVSEWNNGDGRPFTARAMYRGALWNIELAQGVVARPGTFTIREVKGSNLVVSGNMSSES